ncbi:hypothetical protein ACRDU6_09800 [Mycolicibacterium sp. ELW1]|uniref:hypothetical protein n=1 Tax=Mycobacteriaceae TaxID=1762 RepID=UPI00256FCB40|nr:hypothetical protein [Mycobacterium sp. ELW1]
MKPAAADVRIGTRFVYDGEIAEVVELHYARGDVVLATKDLRTGTFRRIALKELMFSDQVRLLGDDLNPELSDYTTPAAVVWDAASEAERCVARERAAHVREVLTGYRSGNARTASAFEPRAAYRLNTARTERIAAKARELHCGFRTVERPGSLRTELVSQSSSASRSTS